VKRKGLAARVLVWMAAEVGCGWIARRRARYRRLGERLSEAERGSLDRYFDSGLLESVCVARVERIEPALPMWLVRRLPAGVDISMAAGMAFGDAVVLTRGEERREDPRSLLFHELVHCAQYRAMGVRGFLREYLGGWVDVGFDYFSIPLEMQAYAMQERFEKGEVFGVEAEIRG